MYAVIYLETKKYIKYKKQPKNNKKIIKTKQRKKRSKIEF